MIIKIPAFQIPQYWEIIKYTSTKADEINPEDLHDYLMILLQDLLSDFSQCFVRLNDSRKIALVAITSIRAVKLYKKRRLLFQCVYSFEGVPIDTWQEDLNMLKSYALKSGCSDIYFQSRNPKIWKITKEVGFREDFRTYSIEI